MCDFLKFVGGLWALESNLSIVALIVSEISAFIRTDGHR